MTFRAFNAFEQFRRLDTQQYTSAVVAATLTLLDDAGTAYDVPLDVLDSDATPYTVTADVLDSDSTQYTVI